jgi:fumarate reductase iron-sulfur subunit
MPSSVALTVARYRPERESEPTFQTYEIPFRKDWVILDALNHIKDSLDGSLSFRWSCRMGVCGSCGMKVNGTPKLTCATFLSDYLSGPIRVEPLDYFPVVRDLVVDLTDFMRKLKQVKPWIIRKEEKPSGEGEYLQTPDQLDAYKQFSMCINCMLCYSACPIYGLEPSFIGPAAIALAQRYNMDSRDEGAAERLKILSEHDGIWQCTFVGECTKVCPKHVDPAGAIQQYKLTGATNWVKSLLLPWSTRYERRAALHPVPSSVVSPPRVGLVVASEAVLHWLCPAGTHQHLRGLLRRAVSMAAPRPYPGSRGP